MRKLCATIMMLLVLSVVAIADPVTVYDVSVQPDNLNKKVTVNYRLAETAGGYASVAVNISSNAGESWTVPATTFYPGSDVGSGVPADGSLRQFIWDARADWNNEYSTQMIVRIDATASAAQDWVFYVSGDNLYRMNLDGGNVTFVSAGFASCEFICPDVAGNRLLMEKWGDGARIYDIDVVNGGSLATLYNGPGINGGQGLAYDRNNSILFLGLYYNGVYALSNSATGWRQLVSPTQISPLLGERGQLQFDAANQHVYFKTAYNGYCDQCRYIWRVNYNGSGLAQIIPANGGDALDLDLASGHMYFSDEPGNGTIKRANLDGSNVQTILTLSSPYNFCKFITLDVPHNKIYMYLFSEAGGYANRVIARANLDGTSYEVLREESTSTSGHGIALFLH